MKKMLMLSVMLSSFAFASEVPKIYPSGKVGEAVKLGEELLNKTDTHSLTSQFVGNKLQCKSCHRAGADGKPGTADSIGTFVGISAKFPIYQARVKVIETLEDRISNCFIRSMNGSRPISETEAPIAIATYITWLSSGTPININAKTNGSSKAKELAKKFAKIQKKATHKNYLNGKKLFSKKCATCHGKNGEGVATFPPLWGQGKDGKWLSYNAGAGMSKLNKAAMWIQSNMPLGQGGTLSAQEAADIALFIDAQPRADFNLEKLIIEKKIKGYYNSKVFVEKDSVRDNFKALGLDVDVIRGDKLMP
ncbi:MAG: c-type cytochrome [Campylobacterota bacterium]|nr:c-type cytochrome [Campylobacterota bacterium]